ncbi:MAG TPA: stage V sporulation protein R, partial [Moorella mulderi]|nr:stage V sporulation protein R [Moorella mulderi]
MGKLRELESIIREVLEVSRLEGLDFYPLHFTCCSLETMCSLGAMGAGKRFFHWSFGQDYHRIKLYHSLRLGKIYELVFFSNPCLAFLLESNSPLENKLVVAHVAAHSDFFK